MADRTSTVRVKVDTDATGGISGLSKFGRAAGAAALGVGALVIGGALAAKKLYAFGDAVDDANVSIETGLRTMKLFGKATDDVARRVENQAVALSKQTAIDQVVIKTTQAKLLTFKELAKTADETGGNFDRATKAAIDLAAKGFGTAETNAVQLGKALNDPVKGLTSLGRAGITFSDSEKERIKTLVESNKLGQAQALVLKAIESQVGGTAAATAGGFELMQNRVKLFGQELALKALPYLDRFGNFMITTGGPAIARFASVVGEKVVPYLRQFGTIVQTKVLPVLSALGGFIVDHLAPAVGKVLSGALEGARGLFENVAKSVHKNGPELQDMGDKLKRVGTFLVDKVLPVLGDFYKVYLPLVGKEIGFAITAISKLWSAFNTIYDIVTKVIDKVGDLIDKLGKIPGAGKLGDLVGAVTRSSDGGGANLNGIRVGGGTTINIATLVSGSDEETGRKLREILDRHDRRRSGAFA